VTLPMEHVALAASETIYPGLYPATVSKLAEDPSSLKRIEVELDWLATTTNGTPPKAWAVLATPYADGKQGFQMLPEIGSTVVVGFQAGFLDHPYVVGAMWNGKTDVPEAFTDKNDKRLIKTRSGSLLEFDDTDGKVAIRIRSAGATEGAKTNQITLDDAGQSITISSASGATITLTTAGGVTIDAAATVDVTAASVTVKSDMSTFTGTIVCDTLIAKGGGVVAPTYTPGAGNTW
jgi:uncharacterized protein involved in type VI secretion and phage assembly